MFYPRLPCPPGPLQEIRDRYPPWLEAKRGSLPAADYERYAAQYDSICRVCAHYEAAPGDYAKLMDLIQEVGDGCHVPVGQVVAWECVW